MLERSSTTKWTVATHRPSLAGSDSLVPVLARVKYTEAFATTTAKNKNKCVTANTAACQAMRFLQGLNHAPCLTKVVTSPRVGAARHTGTRVHNTASGRTPKSCGEFSPHSVISHLTARSILRHGRRAVELAELNLSLYTLAAAVGFYLCAGLVQQKNLGAPQNCTT